MKTLFAILLLAVSVRAEFDKVPAVLKSTNVVFWFSFDEKTTNKAGALTFQSELGKPYSLLTSRCKQYRKRLEDSTSTLTETPSASVEQPVDIGAGFGVSCLVGGIGTRVFEIKSDNWALSCGSQETDRKPGDPLRFRIPGRFYPYDVFLKVTDASGERAILKSSITESNSFSEHHVALSISSKREIKLYVDGVLSEGIWDRSPSGRATFNVPRVATTLENVVMFNRGLSTEEMKALGDVFPWSFGFVRAFRSPWGMEVVFQVLTGESWRPFVLLRRAKVDGFESAVDTYDAGTYLNPVGTERGLEFHAAPGSKAFFRAALNWRRF